MIQLEPLALKARNRLFAMFVLLCGLDIVLVIMARDLWAIGRILFTLVVMYFVLQGRKWAKWLLVGICSFLFFILIAMVLLLRAKLSMTLMVGSLIMAVLSAIIAIYLIKSKDLNSYFAYKRKL
jgi:hypothetical protein